MNLPCKFIERMSTIPDFDIEGFINSYSYPAETAVRLNPIKENHDMLFVNAYGDKEKVMWCNNGRYISKNEINGNDPYHIAGLFYFQEPSAMCVAEMLPVEEGDMVLDLCAAPGGKTTQIAVRGSINLVSNEIVPKRAKILSENVERMGLKNVIVTNESPECLEKKFNNFFDKIIIDAPCSGEGMFKKEASALEAWSIEHVESCALRQKKIIDSAMKMLSTGGSIVYSTCTFAKEENEDNIEYIVNKYPYMKIEKVKHIYPHLSKGEGHFAALITDTRDKTVKKHNEVFSSNKIKKEIDLYREFEKEFLNVRLNGEFVLFGENLYLLPCAINIDKLKTLRPGLHLGVCKKGRFEPAHALVKALKKNDIKNIIDLDRNSIELNKFLKGETLNCYFSGYCAVACDGLPIGWGKGTNGVLKNKFPKGLRIF